MKRREKWVISRVEDLLETHPERWWLVAEMADEYESRWGPVEYGTVQQALFKLKHSGEAESKAVMTLRSEPRTAFRWNP